MELSRARGRSGVELAELDSDFTANNLLSGVGLPAQDAVAYSLAIFLQPGDTYFLGRYNKYVRYSNPATPVADEDKSNAHGVINQQMKDLYAPER
jgi:hypothetical protein